MQKAARELSRTAFATNCRFVDRFRSSSAPVTNRARFCSVVHASLLMGSLRYIEGPCYIRLRFPLCEPLEGFMALV